MLLGGLILVDGLAGYVNRRTWIIGLQRAYTLSINTASKLEMPAGSPSCSSQQAVICAESSVAYSKAAGVQLFKFIFESNTCAYVTKGVQKCRVPNPAGTAGNARHLDKYCPAMFQLDQWTGIELGPRTQHGCTSQLDLASRE